MKVSWIYSLATQLFHKKWNQQRLSSLISPEALPSDPSPTINKVPLCTDALKHDELQQ